MRNAIARRFDRLAAWVPADWQVFILAALFGLLFIVANHADAQQQDSIGPPPAVAIPAEWVDSLEAHYAGYVERGYCLSVEQRADTFFIRQIRTPRAIRARVINGKLGGVEFSCPSGSPTLHTHPDSLCAPDGTRCEFVPIEMRQYPSLADLHALKLSGAPFDIIQYGPRDFWIYRLAPAVPPKLKSAALPSSGFHATPAADTLPPLDSLAKLKTALDSMLFERDAIDARIDSLTHHKGQVGAKAIILPRRVVSTLSNPRALAGPVAGVWLASVNALHVGTELHHFWYGVPLLASRHRLVQWLGLAIMADDAYQHLRQARGDLRYRSPLHRAYARTLYRWTR